jgi:putative tryptophan/tyrosine transport system substrate-binding protein
VRRREFISLVGAATAWPLAARAQQPERMRRIGVLMGIADDAEGRARIAAFQHELEHLGWSAGRNLRIDERWGAADDDSIKRHAAALVELKPDVVLVYGGLAARGLQAVAGPAMPIVFVGFIDAVAEGVVANVAHPGANITGFTLFEYSISGKLVELLKEIAPGVARVALVVGRNNVARAGLQRSLEAAAAAFSVRSIVIPFADAAEIERGIGEFERQGAGSLVVAPDIGVVVHRDRIIALADRHRLPAAYPYRTFAPGGGLACYGTDITDLHRRAAGYVDRILKGEKPADLPVQAPTKYELVINLKTARALGLEVPPTLLARADEVIE